MNIYFNLSQFASFIEAGLKTFKNSYDIPNNDDIITVG